MIPKAVFAYFRERFPLINMALFAILFFTVQAVSTYFIPLQPERSIWWVVMGVLAVISFFFRLRVFDEIKDFKIDARNHPQRVLQSGRIQIKHLVTLSLLGNSMVAAVGLAGFYSLGHCLWVFCSYEI